MTDEIYCGYINYFEIDPINSSIIYYATTYSLFKSVDSGKTWENIGLSD